MKISQSKRVEAIRLSAAARLSATVESGILAGC
jgi:hypothetical protein